MRLVAIIAAALLAASPAVAQSCDDGEWLYTYAARVVQVYDGDTIKADVDLGFGVTLRKETFRLYGVDAPEMRGADRPQGILARDWLRARVLGREVTLKTIKDRKGKYGRWLAIICDANGDVIEDMVAAGLVARKDY